ncbi:MAG: hypothetical protein ACLSCR_04575 [Akkermansia sp.]
MNKYMKSFWLLPLAGLSLSLLPSCTTDSYGNTAVTPGGAAAIGVGALAAGAAIGAAVQHDRDKDRYRNDWNHHHPPPPLLVPTIGLTGRGNSLCGMIESGP